MAKKLLEKTSGGWKEKRVRRLGMVELDDEDSDEEVLDAAELPIG